MTTILRQHEPRDLGRWQWTPGHVQQTVKVLFRLAASLQFQAHDGEEEPDHAQREHQSLEAVERAIEDRVPVDFQLYAHHWLILHGRYHCKARKPMCPTCIIRDLCEYEEKTE